MKDTLNIEENKEAFKDLEKMKDKIDKFENDKDRKKKNI